MEDCYEVVGEGDCFLEGVCWWELGEEVPRSEGVDLVGFFALGAPGETEDLGVC